MNPFFLPHEGGIERRMVALGREFLRAGHSVSVVTSRLDGWPSREEVEGMEVRRIDARPAVPYDPPSLLVRGGGLAVARAILAEEPDAVDCQYRWSPAYAMGMERVLREGVPATFTFHNVFGEGRGILRPLSYVNDSVMKLHISKHHRIACVSDFVRRDLVRRGFPAERVRVCHNALDPPNPAGARSGPGGTFGLFVGRLISTKGLEHLLRALALLKRARGRELEFVIAGDGPRKDRLVALASRLRLRRARFAGRISEDEKWALMRSCALFAMPSVDEAFGMAALEAMSCGRPVVSTCVGGLPEVVGEAGLLVGPRSPGEIAGAMERILEDPALAAHLGALARSRAAGFTWEDAASKMLTIYREASGERAATARGVRDYRPAGSGLAASTGEGRGAGLEPFRSDS